MPVAASACVRNRQIVGPFERERAEVREAAHQDDVDHAEVERRVRVLRHDGNEAGEFAPLSSRRSRRSTKIVPADGSIPASSLSSVVLPEPFGPSSPTRSPGAMVSETASTRAARSPDTRS